MKLVVLEQRQMKVVAVLKEREQGLECPSLEFLSEQPANLQASAKGMKKLFRLYAQRGPEGLTGAMFHLADQNEGIYEFIKGDLRLFCFKDEDESLVIVSNGGHKKSQKANKKDVATAVRVRDEYFAAKKSGHIQLLEIDTLEELQHGWYEESD